MQNDKSNNHWRELMDSSSATGGEGYNKEAGWEKLSRRLQLANENKVPVVSMQPGHQKGTIRRWASIAALLVVVLGVAWLFQVNLRGDKMNLTSNPNEIKPVVTNRERPVEPAIKPTGAPIEQISIAPAIAASQLNQALAGNGKVRAMRFNRPVHPTDRRLPVRPLVHAVNNAHTLNTDSSRPSIDAALLATEFSNPLTPKPRKWVHLNEIRTAQELLGLQPAKEQIRMSFFNRREPTVTNSSTSNLIIPFNH